MLHSGQRPVPSKLQTTVGAVRWHPPHVIPPMLVFLRLDFCFHPVVRKGHKSDLHFTQFSRCQSVSAHPGDGVWMLKLEKIFWHNLSWWLNRAKRETFGAIGPLWELWNSCFYPMKVATRTVRVREIIFLFVKIGPFLTLLVPPWPVVFNWKKWQPVLALALLQCPCNLFLLPHKHTLPLEGTATN